MENMVEHDQRFKTVSREIKILTARNIVKQIRELETQRERFTQPELEEFATKRALDSGWKDKRILIDVAAMVTKLYHFGDNLPDDQL